MIPSVLQDLSRNSAFQTPPRPEEGLLLQASSLGMWPKKYPSTLRLQCRRHTCMCFAIWPKFKRTFRESPWRFGEAGSQDLHVGRKAGSWLRGYPLWRDWHIMKLWQVGQIPRSIGAVSRLVIVSLWVSLKSVPPLLKIVEFYRCNRSFWRVLFWFSESLKWHHSFSGESWMWSFWLWGLHELVEEIIKLTEPLDCHRQCEKWMKSEWNVFGFLP